MCHGTMYTHTHTHSRHRKKTRKKNYNSKNVKVVQRVDLIRSVEKGKCKVGKRGGEGGAPLKW